jgi:hypothetical protein
VSDWDDGITARPRPCIGTCGRKADAFADMATRMKRGLKSFMVIQNNRLSIREIICDVPGGMMFSFESSRLSLDLVKILWLWAHETYIRTLYRRDAFMNNT